MRLPKCVNHQLCNLHEDTSHGRESAFDVCLNIANIDNNFIFNILRTNELPLLLIYMTIWIIRVACSLAFTVQRRPLEHTIPYSGSKP